MRRYACGFVLLIFAFASWVFGQDIKTEVLSAFVWGQDSPSGAISSTIQDPLTGIAIRKLTYGPIEVNSRIGFEQVSTDEVMVFLNYTTTIVNGGDSPLSVRYGGISINGHAVSLSSVILSGKKLNKHERKDKAKVVDLEKIHCFASRFLSTDHLFSANNQSQTLTVFPKTALTVSSVVRDPRSYAIRCSMDGCHLIGTIRYYLTLNSQDYVFVWPGRSAIDCGKP